MTRKPSWRRAIALAAATIGLLTGCGSGTDPGSGDQSNAPAGTSKESFEVKPELMERALGTTDTAGVPEPVLGAFNRAGAELTGEQVNLAIRCWKQKTCETGTGGDVTVALADGFGENVWREVTHMEFVLQALTYPEIGKIVYTSAQGDTQKAISDFRSLIAQGVDVITTFPDAGEALLPTARQATAKGITVVPYIAGLGGTPGKDYLAYVAEDLCQLGKNFAGVFNTEVGSGKVAFLGGTPGNPLSKAWQDCEGPELADGIDVVATADTNWTREGTLSAVSGILSRHPDLKGISYEYADGFLGGLNAYESAGRPLDVVLTLRTDELGLFCEWKKLKHPGFKVFYSSGGGFDSRIALTAAMMQRAGAEVPDTIVVPAAMRQVDASTCDGSIPAQAPASTLVPGQVLSAMYEK